MKLPLLVVAVSLSLGALAGCAPARIVAVPISPKARLEMGDTAGIPYYVPRPYLLVTRDFVIDDAALSSAGIVPGGARELAGAKATGNGGGTGGSKPTSGVSGADDLVDAIQAKPAYNFRVVYLPDLARQYALQQRGGLLSNVQVKYELEGGWMFKGTEISSESRAVEAIEATSSGVANILGSSLEQVFASLFPIPLETAGVSGVGGAGGTEEDIGPKVWLFEIGDGPQGTLNVNMDRPFFEWPRETRSRRRGRSAVETGGDPDFGDVRRPPATRPTLPPPGPTAPVPVPSTGSSLPTQPGPEAPSSQPSPSPGATPPGPYPP